MKAAVTEAAAFFLLQQLQLKVSYDEHIIFNPSASPSPPPCILMISCAQMCQIFAKGYSFYDFFFNSWGASPPDPPLPLFKSLQKSLCFVEHENQLGGKRKHTEKR